VSSAGPCSGRRSRSPGCVPGRIAAKESPSGRQYPPPHGEDCVGGYGCASGVVAARVAGERAPGIGAGRCGTRGSEGGGAPAGGGRTARVRPVGRWAGSGRAAADRLLADGAPGRRPGLVAAIDEPTDSGRASRKNSQASRTCAGQPGSAERRASSGTRRHNGNTAPDPGREPVARTRVTLCAHGRHSTALPRRQGASLSRPLKVPSPPCRASTSAPFAVVAAGYGEPLRCAVELPGDHHLDLTVKRSVRTENEPSQHPHQGSVSERRGTYGRSPPPSYAGTGHSSGTPSRCAGPWAAGR